MRLYQAGKEFEVHHQMENIQHYCLLYLGVVIQQKHSKSKMYNSQEGHKERHSNI